MSAWLTDVRTVSHHSATVTVLDAGAGRTHPRGHGFQVLSRMARSRANDDDYAPRHRRDVTPDLDVRVLAS